MASPGSMVLIGAVLLVSGAGARAQDLETKKDLIESVEQTGPSADCPVPEGIEVARVHEQSHRLFVIVKTEAVERRQQAKRLLRRLADYVRRCHSRWADRWWVTIMADAKLAGFKTEPEILPYVKNGSWSRGYLGEYEHRRSVLVRFPLIPERRDELEIHLRR